MSESVEKRNFGGMTVEIPPETSSKRDEPVTNLNDRSFHMDRGRLVCNGCGGKYPNLVLFDNHSHENKVLEPHNGIIKISGPKPVHKTFSGMSEAEMMEGFQKIPELKDCWYEDGKFFCCYCKKSFKNPYVLFGHIVVHPSGTKLAERKSSRLEDKNQDDATFKTTPKNRISRFHKGQSDEISRSKYKIVYLPCSSREHKALENKVSSSPDYKERIDDERIDDERIQYEMMNYDTTEDETSDVEIVNDETIDGEMVDVEIIDDETDDCETVDDETVDDKGTDGEAVDNETVDDEGADGETVDNETVDDEAVDDETVDDEGTDGEAVGDEGTDDTEESPEETDTSEYLVRAPRLCRKTKSKSIHSLKFQTGKTVVIVTPETAGKVQTSNISDKGLIFTDLDEKKKIKAFNTLPGLEKCKTENGRFFCDECGRQYDNPYLLFSHRLYHNKENKAVFGEDSSMDKVVFYRLPGIENCEVVYGQYICDICQEVFSNPYLLFTHKQMSHLEPVEGKEPASQEVTVESLFGETALKNCRIYKGAFYCSACGASFSNPYLLLNHQLMHTNKGRNPCPKIELEENDAPSVKCEPRLTLDESDSNKEVTTFECNACELGFTSLDSLAEHVENHAQKEGLLLSGVENRQTSESAKQTLKRKSTENSCEKTSLLKVIKTEPGLAEEDNTVRVKVEPDAGISEHVQCESECDQAKE